MPEAPEFTPFYDIQQFVHPEEGAGNGPGNFCVVSTHGVQIGDIVISVVNGSLCANPVDGVPDSINFGAYIADLLANGNTAKVDPRLVVFDTEALRYK